MTTAEQLYREAVQLPATDRRRLAVSLLRTLDDEATDVAAGWEQEIRRRIDAAHSGEEPPLDWDDAMTRIFGE
ncbi:MAG: addiction module protein [Dehalococcoidia bacterium]